MPSEEHTSQRRGSAAPTIRVESQRVAQSRLEGQPGTRAYRGVQAHCAPAATGAVQRMEPEIMRPHVITGLSRASCAGIERYAQP
jgi:hypothetical protein